MLVIDVSQQLKEPIGSIRRYRIDESGERSVYGEVDLLRTDRGILVRGTLETEVKAVCSRCLSSFDQSLTIKMEEEYLPEPEAGAFVITEDQEIDLADAVRQYSLLTFPMKPLCRTDCGGLCPWCGYNLNLGSCSCPSGELDPHFTQLARLASEEKG